jgi:adenylate kinase family enzyme
VDCDGREMTSLVSDTAQLQVNFAPLDQPLGRRISVIGGGGKTTLARAISVKLGLPFVELDALHWLPGWVESDAESFKAKVSAALEAAPDGWVVDGNYGSKMGGFVLGQTDTVVWVNMPWRVMFWRVLRRSFQRAWDKQLICGENRESWRQTLSTNSLWWWHIMHRKQYNTRDQRVLPLVRSGVPVIDIASPRDLNRFYEVQGLVRS